MLSNVTDLIANIDASSRPLQLLKEVVKEPSLILVLDQSINERISAVYISIAASFSDFLLPHGLISFAAVSEDYARSSTLVNDAHGNIIMSFVGAFLFELGIISLLYFIVLGRAIGGISDFRGRVFWVLSLGCVLLTAVPVGFPLVGYVIALLGASNRVKLGSQLR